MQADQNATKMMRLEHHDYYKFYINKIDFRKDLFAFYFGKV